MIAVFATCFILLLSVIAWRKRDSKLPPGPRGVPILGLIPFLGKIPAKHVDEWTKKHGGLATIRLGQYDFVSISDYELLQEVVVKQGQRIAGRPGLPVFQAAAKDHGIISAGQTIWDVHRPFTTQSLKRLGMGKSNVAAMIQREADCLVEHLRGKDEKSVVVEGIILRALTNIISSVALGERFDYGDPRLQEFVSILTRGWHDPIDGPLIRLMLYSKHLHRIPPFRGAFKRYISDCESLHTIFRKCIGDHKETFDGNEMRDFIDVYLDESKKTETKLFYDQQLSFAIKDLFDGAVHTSTSTLSWSILTLVTFPEIQAKLQQEVDKVVGTSRTVEMKDRERMPLVLAFYHEIMRRHTPVSFAHVRNLEPLHAAGYTFPKNTKFIINMWAVHNNPKYFEKPSEFDMNRFINPKDGTFVKSRYWMPFSVGRRNCLGDQQAHMQIFILLVTLLQKFHIRAKDKNSLPPLDEGAYGIVYVPQHDVEVKFVPRDI